MRTGNGGELHLNARQPAGASRLPDPEIIEVEFAFLD
jgi:hypothetical protein